MAKRKLVIVKHPVKKEDDSNTLEIDLLWYDMKYKKMRKFKGGRLVMRLQLEVPFYLEVDKDFGEWMEDAVENGEYKQEERWLPIVEKITLKKKKASVDRGAVLKFFQTYDNYNNHTVVPIEASSDNVVFSVAENEIDDFIYEINRSGIYFEVNDYA